MATVSVDTDKVAKIIRKQVKDLALDGDLKTNHFPNGEAFESLETTAKYLASYLSQRNGQFKPDAFLKKCGVT